MSSSGIIRVPAEEYVIYYPPTDQSDSRITLNCSINVHNAIVIIQDDTLSLGYSIKDCKIMYSM